MQGPPQLEQRVTGDEDVPEHLGSPGGRPRTAPDEHEHEQDHLRLIAPLAEIRAGVPCRGQDGQRLKQPMTEREEEIGAGRSPQEQRDEHRGHDRDARVGLELFVTGHIPDSPSQHAVLQREVRPGEEHEAADDPFDRRILISHDRLGIG